MKREAAERPLELSSQLDASAREMTIVAHEIEEPDQRRTFLSGIGEMIGAVSTHVQVPAVHAFPDLDPLKAQE